MFRNGIEPKKQLKRAFFAFFGDITGENLNKTVTSQLGFHVMKPKVLPRKLSYETLQSWHLLPASPANK